MTETLKQAPMIIKGTYVDREMLSKYKIAAAETGATIESIGPGEEREYLVRTSFNSVKALVAFNERVEVPQVSNG